MLGLTRIKWGPIKNTQIKCFIRHFQVDMNAAQESDPASYTNFNSFFTRKLKPDKRPITTGIHDIACPVDGCVSESGAVDNGTLIQAKGIHYSLTSLVGGSKPIAKLFENGSFVTLYLSPKDYHRIHMPISGTLLEMRYVPGRIFSVNKQTTNCLTNLFTRNERAITLFDTEAGPVAMILVGALFVSGIETVWAGNIRRVSNRSVYHRDYRGETEYPIKLSRGQEMGRFNMGSTAIVLFGANRATFSEDIRTDVPVNMGQKIGIIR